MEFLLRRLLYECDGEVPLEYCFFTIRQGSSFFLLFVTQHDYPESPPQAFQAPFVKDLDLMDPVETFHKLWAVRQPVQDPLDWEWSADKFLLQYMIAIEVDMGLRPPTTFSIPIQFEEDGLSLSDGRDAAAETSVSEFDKESAVAGESAGDKGMSDE